MNRLVFLFELDSVRNEPEEILRGQQSAFAEIVKNGNRVVLAFNQLTDSLAFLAAVKNPKTYPYIMQLFEEGALKVSRYGNMRTASQYIQQSITKCLAKDDNSFIFSGLPVRSDDKVLLETLLQTLKNSDPSLLTDLIDDVQNKLKVCDPSEEEQLQKELERLDYILRYTKMILMLSVERPSSNPPKRTPSRSLPDFINIVLEFLPQITFDNTEMMENMDAAIGILQNIREHFEQTDPERKLRGNRTNWVHQLYRREDSVELHLAEAILHLCYNYAIEDSISDISKRYDDADFDETFRADFKLRLEEYWNNSRDFLHDTDTETNVMSFDGKLPNWAVASRVSEYSEDDLEQPKYYDADSKRERLRWFNSVLKNYFKVLLITCGHIAIFCGVDVLIGRLQDASVNMVSSSFWSQISATVISVIMFGLVSSGISVIFKLPDILDCIQSIFIGIWDLFVIARTQYDIYQK